MLTAAAGFSSLIISSELLFRNWLIASPETTKYCLCPYTYTIYSPIMFPLLMISLTRNLLFWILKSISNFSIFIYLTSSLFLYSLPKILPLPSTSTAVGKTDFSNHWSHLVSYRLLTKNSPEVAFWPHRKQQHVSCYFVFSSYFNTRKLNAQLNVIILHIGPRTEIVCTFLCLFAT